MARAVLHGMHRSNRAATRWRGSGRRPGAMGYPATSLRNHIADTAVKPASNRGCNHATVRLSPSACGDSAATSRSAAVAGGKVVGTRPTLARTLRRCSPTDERVVSSGPARLPRSAASSKIELRPAPEPRRNSATTARPPRIALASGNNLNERIEVSPGNVAKSGNYCPLHALMHGCAGSAMRRAHCFPGLHTCVRAARHTP